VLYVNQDTGEQVDIEGLVAIMGRDAESRAESGWRLTSVASIPIRQSGTVGNVLFDSGAQTTIFMALTALYVLEEGAG
jgi:hypothetical protein